MHVNRETRRKEIGRIPETNNSFQDKKQEAMARPTAKWPAQTDRRCATLLPADRKRRRAFAGYNSFQLFLVFY
jgi:hypothetical protein